jgi:hypothetical protein
VAWLVEEFILYGIVAVGEGVVVSAEEDQIFELVSPPSAQWISWWASHHRAGRRHLGVLAVIGLPHLVRKAFVSHVEWVPTVIQLNG